MTAADQAAWLAELALKVQGARADLRAAVAAAKSSGMTEVEIARATGLSRSTVRAWLGKS